MRCRAIGGAGRVQLDAANAALSADGSLIASQPAASIGLDDTGVLQSSTLGEKRGRRNGAGFT